MKRIVVPVDFSEPSRRAIDYAAKLAGRVEGQLVLVHAVEPVYYPLVSDMYGVGADLGSVYDEVDRAAREQLSELAATLRKRKLTVRTIVAHGTAPQVIVDTAKKLKAELLIVSTHGRTGLSHVLMGSVAERVVRTAPCRVLVVPGRPTKRRKRATARRRRPARGRAARA